MGPKRRHRKLARLGAIQMRGFAVTGQPLPIDLALQFHEGMQQRLRPGRASGNINIDRDITVDPFQNVVALFERPAGNRARTHRDHVFRIGHLVVKPDDLRRHFLGHRAGHDHQIRLTR